jgi:hypothetical protein
MLCVLEGSVERTVPVCGVRFRALTDLRRCSAFASSRYNPGGGQDARKNGKARRRRRPFTN